MTRDFDLIRKLLVFFDEKPGIGVVKVADIHVGDEYSEDLIQYHLILMFAAGLLICEAERSASSDRVIQVWPFNLTWEGHEFLAKIRADSVWQKIKTTITSKGSSLAFTVINQLATRYAVEAATAVLALKP